MFAVVFIPSASANQIFTAFKDFKIIFIYFIFFNLVFEVAPHHQVNF